MICFIVILICFLVCGVWSDKKPMEILPNLKADGMYEAMVHQILVWIEVCLINHIGLLIFFCVILCKCGQ